MTHVMVIGAGPAIANLTTCGPHDLTFQQSPTRRSPVSSRSALVRIGASILLLHILGAALLAVSISRGVSAAGGTFGVGFGLAAYALGVRHAFDADHIAAIDSTTRNLVRQDEHPLSIGFWFALGHSTVVFALCVILGFGARTVAPALKDDSSGWQTTAGTIGVSVAASFLVMVAILNTMTLGRISVTAHEYRRGRLDEAGLEGHLATRGLGARILKPLVNTVRSPRHMYPVGLLFGLGFDTATEVALLAMAGGAAVTLPWYSLLALPLLFAAGMCLFDSLDGIVMQAVCSWSLYRPGRRIYVNLAVTLMSVLAALTVAAVMVANLMAERLGVSAFPIGILSRMPLEYAGFAIAALFALIWLGALLALRGGGPIRAPQLTSRRVRGRPASSPAAGWWQRAGSRSS